MSTLGDSPIDSKALRTARRAVERSLVDLASEDLVLVACSGGADSLALAAAAAHCQAKGLVRAGAVVIDHGLQANSATVAAQAAQQCAQLGLAPVEVVQVQVALGSGSGGVEAAARAARYGAFEQVASKHQVAAILLAHTQDDQAETVLLGLARGSGSRSIKGMNPVAGLWRRPFLGLGRAETEQVCATLNMEPYSDPHNQDQQFARVRVRSQVIPALQAALGESVVPALARTAQQLQDDCSALDDLAATELAARTTQTADRAVGHALAIGGDLPLAEVARAVRTRVIRLFLLGGGCDAERLSSTHIDSIDSLVVDWRGRGPVRVPGDREVARVEADLLLYEAGPISRREVDTP